MNRQKSIALFAAIAAVAMTTISLTGVSTTSLAVSSMPQNDGMEMLGHVQYTVLDQDDQIKSYIQGDNAVVDEGKDCVGALVFGATNLGNCIDTTTKFNYIAVGNGTTLSQISAQSPLTQLTNDTNTGCSGTTGDAGELGRLLVTPVYSSIADDTQGAAGGSKIELNTDTPFEIVAGNATTIFQSGIFNGDETSSTTGACTSITKGSMNMFSIQELNNAVGITVTAGDSLSVKWTITIG